MSFPTRETNARLMRGLFWSLSLGFLQDAQAFVCPTTISPSTVGRGVSSSQLLVSLEPVLIAEVEPPPASEPSSDTFTSPKWMKCLNGVTKSKLALNEAVYQLCHDNGLSSITREDANELISLGAVWAKMETLTEDDLMDQYYTSSSTQSAANLQYADITPASWIEWDKQSSESGEELETYVEQMDMVRYRRVLHPCVIEGGLDLRVYPYPRRFPSCYEFADEDGGGGKSRLLYEDTTFIVVDKPPMLPTQPDASNYMECCPGCVNDLMGPFTTIGGDPVHRPLLCHRVDNCVGGCVVLSKDRNGQKVFSEYQRNRKVKKLYLTVTENPVPLGLHVHWMWSPKEDGGEDGPNCQLMSHDPPESRRKARAFWTRCVLEVTKSVPITLIKDHHLVTNSEKSETPQKHYQSTIRLVTGRKHQVRAQLSSLGAPILGDTLYGPMSGMTLDKLTDPEDDSMDDDMLDEAMAQCRIPRHPIGLQAHAILFAGIKAKARVPWWGDGTGYR